MNATTKCKLEAAVSYMGARKSMKSLVTLKFGPVTLGHGQLWGRWSADQVLRELRLNGARKDRFTLTEHGAAVLAAQGIKTG